MPGRLISSPDSYVGPGQQFMSAEDRPVPAVRKNARPLPDPYSGRGTYADWMEKRDGTRPARDGKTQFANGADMTAARRLEGRQNYQPASSPTSFQLPGQPLKAAAMFRPQSAMAFSSPSSSSYSQAKPMYPARPPSSLGVSWGPSPSTPGISGDMRYSQSDVVGRTHQRGHSYGDGVMLGEGSSAVHYTSEKSADVYTSVARRQDRVNNVEAALGYDTHSYRQQETPVSGQHPGTTGHPRADGSVGRNLGQDNPAFVADDQSHRPGETTGRRPSTSLDMRSAWQRLYGNGPDTGVSSRRPSADDVISSGLARSLEDALTSPSSRQQFGQRASPQLSQTHLQHPRMARSHPHQPVHNPAGSSLQNGRLTPQTAGSSSQNGRFTPHTTPNPDFPVGSSSQNGRLTPHAAGDFSQNGRLTPQTAVSSSQNGRSTPHNLASTDWHAGSSTLDHPRTTVRESPTGQSSSNPDPTSGSTNSSQLSDYSATTKTFSTFITQKKKPDGGADPTIGPSSKYPETQMGMRMSAQATHQTGIHKRNRTLSEDKRAESRQSLSSPNFTSKPMSPRRETSSTSEAAGFRVKEDLTRPPSRFSSAFLDSDDSFEDEYSLHPLDSIFNYNEGGSESGRVTPRASPQFTPSTSSHAPRVTSRAPEHTMPGSLTPRLTHRTSPVVTSPAVTSPDFVPKTPDLLRKSPEARAHQQTSHSNTGRTSTQQTENKQKTHLGRPSQEVLKSKDGQRHNPARSRSLDDLRESEDDSLLSFDVENTVLTVEPSDQSDRGTVRSPKGSNSVRAQLSRLEGMYSHVLKTLGETSHGTRTRRRWSIGSSDTSSMRHHSHQHWHSKASAHRLAGRDVKAIGKRFQRLESHVITLARSVAHLSSELRVQNSLSREMENVKREIQELKSQSPARPVLPGNLVRSKRLLTDFERSQGWVPSLTNPRRVNKLTRFFGQEPPLLEIFLKQLGYEKFLKNFEQEHVGMIELPYMTEDKLQGLGIPMGPRLRILQEAQVYFQEANVDVYFV